MADGGEGAPAGAKTPADFLKSIKGKPVIVKLNSGVDYRGAQPPQRAARPGLAHTSHPLPAARPHSPLPPRLHPSRLPLQACWLAWMAT